MSRFRQCLFVVLMLAAAPIVDAQFDSATIVGTVHDASGASIPGTSITLKSLSTGVANNTLSNSAGDYNFNAVAAGDYTIAATSTGFGDIATPAFTVTVGARQRVDINLSPQNVQKGHRHLRCFAAENRQQRSQSRD